MTSNADMYAPRMNETVPAPDISDVGRTSRCYESKGERQEINESTCCAKGVSQFLWEEKQVIARHKEDFKSQIERGAIALNALAPIKRLSHDVLCHIFELHCIDSLPVAFSLNHQLWGPASLKPPQITLSHVCSVWREILLDVPTFWSSIRIFQRNHMCNIPRIFDSVVKVANTWLSRAKGLPCSIDIDFPDHGECYGSSHRLLWEKDWHKNIIRDLISLHKFKKLSVTFADHHLRELLQLPDDRLSCIEDLCLRYVSHTEDDTTSPLDLHKLFNLTSFSLLPNPFNIYSRSNLSEGYSKFASIPWHNLRHIKFRATIPAPFCLDALEHCSALEKCSLVITGDHTFTPSPRAPVNLYQLRELEVIVYSGSSRKEQILEFFLLSFRFPRLKSLTLGSSDYPAILNDLQMLSKVQDVSQMYLEELIIFDSTVGVDVRTLLTRFPSLRRLELLNAVTFTDEAMVEVGAGSIGVFLEDLTINNSGLDIEKLLRMVKARSLRAGDRDGKHQIEVTEFKSVTLHCHEEEDEMGDKVLSFIEEIKLSGVDLDVVFAESADYSDHEESEAEQYSLYDYDDYVDYRDSDGFSDEEAIMAILYGD